MTRTITPTHVLLSQVTLAAASSGVTFSSIPQTFGDLVLLVNGTGNSDNRAFYIRFNGTATDTETSMVQVSNTTSSTDVGLYFISDTTIFSSRINIMDYSATDKHKSLIFRTDRPGASSVMMSAGRWANTNAVTSITIDRSGYTLASGTTLALYGVYA